jgi:uncharacterized protein (TIGR03437 family)
MRAGFLVAILLSAAGWAQPKPCPAEGQLVYGDVAACEINPGDEIERFSFQPAAGDVVAVQVTRRSGPGNPCFTLLSPLGTPVDQKCPAAPAPVARSELRVALGGTYSLALYEQQYGAPVSYEISIDRMLPPRAVRPTRFGQNVAGSLPQAGQVEFYQFSGSAGSVVSVQATWKGGPGVPCLAWLDPDQNLLEQRCGPSVARSELRLAAGGSYTVRIYASGYSETLAYEFYVDRTAPPLDAAALPFGRTLAGSLGHAAELDSYRFNGAAGSTVRLRAGRRSGAGTPCLVLFDPTGALVDRKCGAGSSEPARSELRLTRTGTYLAQIYSDQYSQPLEYDLVLECLSPQCRPPSCLISTESLLGDGTVGISYSLSLDAAECGGARQWTLFSGALPRGLTLDESSGRLAGTPASPGTYEFTIRVADAAGNASTKPFLLTIANGVTVSPPALGFQHRIGRSPPAPQSLSLRSVVPSATFTAAVLASSGGDWLSVTPAGGGAPAMVRVTVSPAGLAPGIYTATLLLRFSTEARESIPVRLTVAPPAPEIARDGIVNAACYTGQAVAPGEIVLLFGSGLGPPELLLALPDGSRQMPLALSGIRVLFDGSQAPLLYVQDNQLSVIVPYTVSGNSNVQVQVESQGVLSLPATLEVLPSWPCLFTLDGSGRGPAAVLNQDGTVNTPANPAPRGSVVSLYATGGGDLEPQTLAGLLAPFDPLHRVRLPVSVTLGGVPASVEYAGASPGLVTGLVQINVRIPDSIAPGPSLPVSLLVGARRTQPAVTIAVR